MKKCLLSLWLLTVPLFAAADSVDDLFEAAAGGDVALLGQALQKGAGPDARGVGDITPLMLSAERGHVDVVRALLAAGASVHAQRPGGITPLMHAAACGDAALVKLLLDAGAKIDARADSQGISALRVAVATGSLDVARLLLDAGADRNEVDESGARLLFTAAGAGSVPLLQLLLVPGEDVNHKRSDGGHTALDVALERHHWAAAQYLIEHGATLRSSVTGKDEVLRKLLELEPVLQPKRANSLVQAVDMPSPELFRAVLAQGATTSYRDEKGNTLLMLAAHRHHVTGIEALLATGADVHARNAAGDTALSIASGKSEYELIVAGIGMALGQDRESLMRVIFRPAAKSSESPSTARRLQIARLLLAARADPNVADAGGNTPLMEATRTGDAELVAMLIEAGAGVNARNRQGSAPVLMAAQFGLHEIATTLVAARADLQVRDAEGQGPLELARAGGHDGLVQLLEQAGRRN